MSSCVMMPATGSSPSNLIDDAMLAVMLGSSPIEHVPLNGLPGVVDIDSDPMTVEALLAECLDLDLEIEEDTDSDDFDPDTLLVDPDSENDMTIDTPGGMQHASAFQQQQIQQDIEFTFDLIDLVDLDQKIAAPVTTTFPRSQSVQIMPTISGDLGNLVVPTTIAADAVLPPLPQPAPTAIIPSIAAAAAIGLQSKPQFVLDLSSNQADLSLPRVMSLVDMVKTEQCSSSVGESAVPLMQSQQVAVDRQARVAVKQEDVLDVDQLSAFDRNNPASDIKSQAVAEQTTNRGFNISGQLLLKTEHYTDVTPAVMAAAATAAEPSATQKQASNGQFQGDAKQGADDEDEEGELTDDDGSQINDSEPVPMTARSHTAEGSNMKDTTALTRPAFNPDVHASVPKLQVTPSPSRPAPSSQAVQTSSDRVDTRPSPAPVSPFSPMSNTSSVRSQQTMLKDAEECTVRPTARSAINTERNKSAYPSTHCRRQRSRSCSSSGRERSVSRDARHRRSRSRSLSRSVVRRSQYRSRSRSRSPARYSRPHSTRHGDKPSGGHLSRSGRSDVSPSRPRASRQASRSSSPAGAGRSSKQKRMEDGMSSRSSSPLYDVDTLFVGDLPWQATSHDLYTVFQELVPSGGIAEARVMSGKSYGFVSFRDPSVARSLLKEAGPGGKGPFIFMDGRQLRIARAETGAASGKKVSGRVVSPPVPDPSSSYKKPVSKPQGVRLHDAHIESPNERAARLAAAALISGASSILQSAVSMTSSMAMWAGSGSMAGYADQYTSSRSNGTSRPSARSGSYGNTMQGNMMGGMFGFPYSGSMDSRHMLNYEDL